ncbi:hypothetical protein NDU88_005882 [Pleurodeles waltl]|uniref:Uncharacterized protein n=1 Tax=Pleurodeles waltl TaxID=8319 RepID=A0AAV7QJH7_PLEWA|nr:hypothetical protein NDU88_005882 [Pleurodeles waltl]
MAERLPCPLDPGSAALLRIGDPWTSLTVSLSGGPHRLKIADFGCGLTGPGKPAVSTGLGPIEGNIEGARSACGPRCLRLDL